MSTKTSGAPDSQRTVSIGLTRLRQTPTSSFATSSKTTPVTVPLFDRSKRDVHSGATVRLCGSTAAFEWCGSTATAALAPAADGAGLAADVGVPAASGTVDVRRAFASRMSEPAQTDNTTKATAPACDFFDRGAVETVASSAGVSATAGAASVEGACPHAEHVAPSSTGSAHLGQDVIGSNRRRNRCADTETLENRAFPAGRRLLEDYVIVAARTVLSSDDLDYQLGAT